MDVVKKALTRTLPAYLRTLPLPDTFAGFLQLSSTQWAQLAPLLATLFVVVIFSASLLPQPAKAPARVNTTVKLGESKVVDCVFALSEIEDSGKKAYCRCWKSATFPLCDGAHNAHNKARRARG